MRLIGHIQDETQTRYFCDFLFGQNIESQVEQHTSGRWEIWITARFARGAEGAEGKLGRGIYWLGGIEPM